MKSSRGAITKHIGSYDVGDPLLDLRSRAGKVGKESMGDLVRQGAGVLIHAGLNPFPIGGLQAGGRTMLTAWGGQVLDREQIDAAPGR